MCTCRLLQIFFLELLFAPKQPPSPPLISRFYFSCLPLFINPFHHFNFQAVNVIIDNSANMMISKILPFLQTVLITEMVVLIKKHQWYLYMIAVVENLSQDKDVVHLLQTVLFELYWFLLVNPFCQESCLVKVKRWPSNICFCDRLIIFHVEWQLPSELSADRLIPVERALKMA